MLLHSIRTLIWQVPIKLLTSENKSMLSSLTLCHLKEKMKELVQHQWKCFYTDQNNDITSATKTTDFRKQNLHIAHSLFVIFLFVFSISFCFPSKKHNDSSPVLCTLIIIEISEWKNHTAHYHKSIRSLITEQFSKLPLLLGTTEDKGKHSVQSSSKQAQI